MNTDLLIVIILIFSFICGYQYEKIKKYKSYYDYETIIDNGIEYSNMSWNKRKIYTPADAISLEPKQGWVNRLYY